MTAKDVERALTTRLFDRHKNIVVPNVASILVPYEADLLVLRPSGWMEEVEIKVDFQDFKREFSAKTKVAKHKRLTGTKPHYVKRFWFAIAEDIYGKVDTQFPDHAGLIVVRPFRWGKLDTFITEVVRAAPNLDAARKVPEDLQFKLLHKTYFRFWNLRDKVGGEPDDYIVDAA